MISAGEMGSWEYVDGRCDWSFLDPEDDVETYQASSEDDLQLFGPSLLASHEGSETQLATVPAPPEEVRTYTEVHPKDVSMTERPLPLQPHEKAEDEPSTSAGPPLLGKTGSSNGVPGYQERVQPTDNKPLLNSHGELTSLTHSKKKPIVQPRVPEVRKFVKKKPEAAPRVRRVPPPPRSSTSQLPRPGIITRTIGTSGPNVYVCIYKDTCWRCSSRGHSAASCKGPWMKFCSHCGLLGVLSKDCACQRYRAERGPKPNTKSIGVQCELRSPGWMPPMPDLRLRPVQRQ
ncbi:hypothetical protein WA026_003279 [Henosepilachna vigintioctopunctata]|uniref:CCHC-type domain-containing protein n=1 Tax=Henosepilachna vigintioctopunctata TaxID=420089 RepID=A0AAW1TP31_9CUCU